MKASLTTRLFIPSSRNTQKASYWLVPLNGGISFTSDDSVAPLAVGVDGGGVRLDWVEFGQMLTIIPPRL